MRTPVLLVTGQGDTDAVTTTLLRRPGTLVVEHRFDGHVVLRTTSMLRHGVLTTTETALELAHGCVSCTIRNNVPVLLRQLHRRAEVERIVVHLPPWMEPEPISVAIDQVRIKVAPGYIDGPAHRDVAIAAVVTCVDAQRWLRQALGEDELDDGRTVARVVVGQAEFSDVVVLTEPEPTTLAVLRRLSPRAHITVGADPVEMALAHLHEAARRGRSNDPRDPLLLGEPPLHAEGPVQLVEFGARRPFHPQRLHAVVDVLLEGVIRTRGRIWLANRAERCGWIESAGGELWTGPAGKWLAAMSPSELAYVDRQRRALAELIWDDRFGDRHTTMTVLVCGANPTKILQALTGALLTDAEMSRRHRWMRYADPFGDWHEDPCDDLPGLAHESPSHRSSGDDP